MRLHPLGGCRLEMRYIRFDACGNNGRAINVWKLLGVIGPPRSEVDTRGPAGSLRGWAGRLCKPPSVVLCHVEFHADTVLSAPFSVDAMRFHKAKGGRRDRSLLLSQ